MNSQIHTAVQFLDFNGVLWYEYNIRVDIYWNVAYTTFIIIYVNTKNYSNLEESIHWVNLTFVGTVRGGLEPLK